MPLLNRGLNLSNVAAIAADEVEAFRRHYQIFDPRAHVGLMFLERFATVMRDYAWKTPPRSPAFHGGWVPDPQAFDAGLDHSSPDLTDAELAREAAHVALQTHSGCESGESAGIERKFREARPYQVAPISTNPILSYVGEHVLGLPRAY